VVMAMMVHPASQDTCVRSSRTVTWVNTRYTEMAPYSAPDGEPPRSAVVHEYAQRKRLIGSRPQQRALGAGGVL